MKITVAILLTLFAINAQAISPNDLVNASNKTISRQVATNAINAFNCLGKDKNKTLIVADMNLDASKQRLWAFKINSNKVTLVTKDYVSHGIGSDPNRTGRALNFSNIPNSEATSLGLYQVGEHYDFRGRVGEPARRLHGLMPEWNDKALVRGVVLHKASYVRSGGRSQGCPAVAPDVYDRLEQTGLDNAVLWIDGPDPSLRSAISNCRNISRVAPPKERNRYKASPVMCFRGLLAGVVRPFICGGA